MAAPHPPLVDAVPVEVLTPNSLRAPLLVALDGGANGVHVVHTRFCLGQGDQPALTAGRMEQLRAICLPSMYAQQDRAFVWLVYIDSTLLASAVEELVHLLRADPRFILLRVMAPWEHVPRTEHPYELPVPEQLRLAGMDAPAQRKHADGALLYISTRLDADDGMPSGAMAYLHRHIGPLARHLDTSSRRLERGLVCWRAALDWYAQDDGRLNVYRKYSTKHCVSAGLTTFSTNPLAPTAHRPSHTRMYTSLTTRLIAPDDDDSFLPLRARSVTSDSLEGMLKASTETRMPEVPPPSDELMERAHNTSLRALRRCGAALLAQGKQIAREQLARRCMHGFGCRAQTQEKLQIVASGATVSTTGG